MSKHEPARTSSARNKQTQPISAGQGQDNPAVPAMSQHDHSFAHHKPERTQRCPPRASTTQHYPTRDNTKQQCSPLASTIPTVLNRSQRNPSSARHEPAQPQQCPARAGTIQLCPPRVSTTPEVPNRSQHDPVVPSTSQHNTTVPAMS